MKFFAFSPLLFIVNLNFAQELPSINKEFLSLDNNQKRYSENSLNIAPVSKVYSSLDIPTDPLESPKLFSSLEIPEENLQTAHPERRIYNSISINYIFEND
jgi:hypothetical protein